MNHRLLHTELDAKVLEIERLTAKLEADLAQVSFVAAELEYDILFTNRDYLQTGQELVEAAEAGLGAEDV